MPYDQVTVRMYLDKLFECGVDLRFELLLGDAGRKLAVGRTGLAWVLRDTAAPLRSEPLPPAISAGLLAG
jgi:acyl-CoA thioesterase FadM